jgi:hypothetical protein
MCLQRRCACRKLRAPPRKDRVLLFSEREQALVDLSQPKQVGPFVIGFAELTLEDVWDAAEIGNARLRPIPEKPEHMDAFWDHL